MSSAWPLAHAPQLTAPAHPAPVLVKPVSTDPGHGRRSYYRSPLLLGLPHIKVILVQVLRAHAWCLRAQTPTRAGPSPACGHRRPLPRPPCSHCGLSQDLWSCPWARGSPGMGEPSVPLNTPTRVLSASCGTLPRPARYLALHSVVTGLLLRGEALVLLLGVVVCGASTGHVASLSPTRCPGNEGSPAPAHLGPAPQPAGLAASAGPHDPASGPLVLPCSVSARLQSASSSLPCPGPVVTVAAAAGCPHSSQATD